MFRLKWAFNNVNGDVRRDSVERCSAYQQNTEVTSLDSLDEVGVREMTVNHFFLAVITILETN